MRRYKGRTYSINGYGRWWSFVVSGTPWQGGPYVSQEIAVRAARETIDNLNAVLAEQRRQLEMLSRTIPGSPKWWLED